MQTGVVAETLRRSAHRLRLQVVVVTTVALLCASALPVVAYVYVFRFGNLSVGPVAWAHWIVAGVACFLGLAAQGAGNKVLLALHVAVCTMLGAGLGGFDTAFWYTLSTRCATSQAAFVGCGTCACAAADACTAADLATDPTCAGCTAYSVDVCAPALQLQNKYILAFMGLAALLFLALPAFYSLLVLVRLEARDVAAAGSREMVGFAVEQQTALVESGEKPNVTPGMLASWVALLLDCGVPKSEAVGEKCRAALASRGFELPVARKKSAGSRQRRGLFGRRGKAGSATKVTADGRANPDALSVAESGGSKGARSTQVAAEEQERRVQFMAGQ